MRTVVANGRLKVPPSLPSPPARADYLIGFELQINHLNLDIKCSDIQELVLSKQGPLELAHFSSPPGSMLMKDVENTFVQLSTFLLRKCDMGIFTLCGGRIECNFDIDCTTALTDGMCLRDYYDCIWIPGTGQESGIFRDCNFDVSVFTAPLCDDDHTIVSVKFEMTGTEAGYEETQVESVMGLLQQC